MRQKAKRAIKKRGFFSIRADQMPTERSKQVFAKLATLPFADPFLPTFRGKSPYAEISLGKNPHSNCRHKDHRNRKPSSKFPSSPKFLLPLKIEENRHISAMGTPFFPG